MTQFGVEQAWYEFISAIICKLEKLTNSKHFSVVRCVI